MQAPKQSTLDEIQKSLQNANDDADSRSSRTHAIIQLENHPPTRHTNALLDTVFTALKFETGQNLSKLLNFLHENKNETVLNLMRRFLESADTVDEVSANLAIFYDGVVIFKNSELETLHNFAPDENTTAIFTTHKNKFTIAALEIILEKILTYEKNEFFFRNFYEINSVLNKNLADEFDLSGNTSESFLKFLASLMVNEKSSLKIFNIVENEGLFSQLSSALSTYRFLKKEYKALIQPRDIDRMEAILMILNKLIVGTASEYYVRKFSDLIEKIVECVSSPLPICLKRQMYEFLRKVSFHKKILDFFQDENFLKRALKDYEAERMLNDYACTVELLRFLAVACPESPRVVEFCVHVVTSEDVEVIICALKIFIINNYQIRQRAVAHALREACYKSNEVAEHVVGYCVAVGHVIPSVELTRAITLVGCPDFFRFVALFVGSTFLVSHSHVFLTADFLARIDADRVSGLKFLAQPGPEIARFVVSNLDFFNEISRSKDPEILKLLLKVYCTVVLNYENLEFSFSNPDSFLIPRFFCSSFFKLLSNRISFFYFNGGNFQPYVVSEYLVDEESLEECCRYLKTCLMAGIMVEIGVVVANYGGRHVDDLVGFYRACGQKVNFSAISVRNRLIEGKKDNDFFMKNYEGGSPYEKYLMLNVFDYAKSSDDVMRGHNEGFMMWLEKVVRNEFLRFKSEGFGGENGLLARNCCLYALLLDNTDAIVRILDDCVLPECLSDLIIKLNTKNLCNGGRSYVKQFMKCGCVEEQARFVYVAWLEGVMGMELKMWAGELRRVGNVGVNEVLDRICY